MVSVLVYTKNTDELIGLFWGCMKISQPLQKQLNAIAVVPNEEYAFKCCLRRYVTSAHSLRSLKKFYYKFLFNDFKYFSYFLIKLLL
jgi:hypothetical protein